MGHIRTLYHLISFTLCHSLQVSDAHLSSDEYFRATSAYLSSGFLTLVSERFAFTIFCDNCDWNISKEVICHQPRTTSMNEEAEQLAWADKIESTDDNSSLPSACMSSDHSMSDNDFALACSFLLHQFQSSIPFLRDGWRGWFAFTYSRHKCYALFASSSPQNGSVKVASGSSVRALLYKNLLWCPTVSRPFTFGRAAIAAKRHARFPLLVGRLGSHHHCLLRWT